MTSEDVTMFRKQLILIYPRRAVFYFCAACCLFVSRIFSLSLSEKTIFHACTDAFFDFFFTRETFQLLFVICVSLLFVCCGGDTKL